MFIPLLFSSVDPLRSFLLALPNFLFLRRDLFLFVVVFDFDLCGPTLLDFLDGCTTTCFKSHCLTDWYLNQLDQENIIDHYILDS